MENNETCIHGGVSPVNLLKELHHSQAGGGRHRCPTCAYEQGFNFGSNGQWRSYSEFCESEIALEKCQTGSFAPVNILINLGENQGGTGRHKCTNCAFKLGFEVGVLEKSINSIELELVPKPTLLEEINNIEINTNASKSDFIEKEIRNRSLGLLGELFIIENEKNYLKSNKRSDLADLVQHVSLETGDGLGYDILSFDLDGVEKKIEVKTTRSNITRPFYLSRNELLISNRHPENYFLFRLFDFDSELNKGKYYIISGDLSKSLKLDAISYIAFPKLHCG